MNVCANVYVILYVALCKNEEGHRMGEGEDAFFIIRETSGSKFRFTNFMRLVSRSVL